MNPSLLRMLTNRTNHSEVSIPASMKIFSLLAIVAAAATILPTVSAEGTRAAAAAAITVENETPDTPEEFYQRLLQSGQFGGAGQCNLYCQSNSDCESDDDEYNPCTKCGKDLGTEYYQRCYNPSKESAGMCNLKCKKDKDCVETGWNPCSSCGEYIGSQYYDHCYNPDTAPTIDCDEGMCCEKCNKNSDCQQGGFNPCGKCGQDVGTQFYRRCYNPEDD